KESFANDEVAKVLNERFVCIKVDREERPDIDNIYMAALHALDQQGGWPLSMFLTADGKPIIGGTYWPREDRAAGAVLQGRRLFADDVAWFQWREVYRARKLRGFKSVLRLVDDTWKKHPREVSRQADALARATARELEGATRLLPLFDLERGLVTEA